MLTRLQVKGFKNLFDVSVDFGPFTCIMGANAVGKSNVFDAIELLSRLAAGPVAGRAGYPLLLTGSPTDLGSGTRTWLAARGAGAVVVIGGSSAVGRTAGGDHHGAGG